MKITPTELPEVLIIDPKVHGDSRGFFYESFQARRYSEAGIHGPFIQDNLSHSVRGTLRGLHFQEPKAQGKLIQVLRGGCGTWRWTCDGALPASAAGSRSS